jgi:hypothetical protein
MRRPRGRGVNTYFQPAQWLEGTLSTEDGRLWLHCPRLHRDWNGRPYMWEQSVDVTRHLSGDPVDLSGRKAVVRLRTANASLRVILL